MENKKIKNATSLEYNDIQFKSKLEILVYKTLCQEGYDVKYEPYKYIIWKGFKPNVPFYTKDKKTKLLKLDDKKLIDITYTPDFVIELNNLTIIIEAKGFENDLFPVKKKLFRKYLEDNMNDVIYFEIFTKKQLLQAINIINEYNRVRTKNGSNSINSSNNGI